jgi:hypothetical protein
MNQKAPVIIIHVSNPAAFSGKGSIIVLEYTDEGAALKVARKIAEETGRSLATTTPPSQGARPASNGSTVSS